MTKLLTACALGLLIHLSPALAADAPPREVALSAKGGAILKGSIKGEQAARYLLRANAASEYAIELKTANTSAYLNISQAGKDEALHIGSIAGNSFKGRLPEAGDYVITVYLMRNAARRNATAGYTLRIAEGR